MDPHEIGRARSLEYHRRIADKLRADPQGVTERALERLDRWQRGGVNPYLTEWRRLLTGPPEALHAVLVAQTEDAATLRSCSPFAGELDARERWRLWREVGEGLRHEAG